MSNRPMISGVILAATMLGATAPAFATTYMFHFEGNGSNGYGDVQVNGVFSTSSPVAAGGVAITRISGVVTGGSPAIVDGSISGLSPYADADNILYAVGINSDETYSFGGVSFFVNRGKAEANYNLYGWNNAANLLVSSIDPVGYPQNGTPAATPSVGGPITNSVTAVPEPTVWALLVSGFASIGLAMRAARQKLKGASPVNS